jgi:hypothetical protein
VMPDEGSRFIEAVCFVRLRVVDEHFIRQFSDYQSLFPCARAFSNMLHVFLMFIKSRVLPKTSDKCKLVGNSWANLSRVAGLYDKSQAEVNGHGHAPIRSPANI